jgi:ubiquinone/menaquinone biosynthesis C-methylase UbiE
MEPVSAEEMRRRAERYLSSCSEYSVPYERERLIADWMKKGDAAQQLVGDFTKRAGDPKGKRVLDLGFGSGFFAVAFAHAGAEVYGLEVNLVLTDIARDYASKENVRADLRVYDGTVFPFPDNFFDYMYATSVLEHVSDARLVLSEISRTLKPGGAGYLSFPNRLAPRETHTGAWFISYLPRSLADFLLRHLKNSNAVEELNLHFLSYFTLRRFIRGLPLRVRYEYGGKTAPRRLLKRVLGALGIHHSAILRTVMVVLEKYERGT